MPPSQHIQLHQPAASPPPFRAERYAIESPGNGPVSLEPIDRSAAEQIAQAMVSIDPWKRLETKAAGLKSYLLADDPHAHKRAIVHGGLVAGVVGVRSPWLFGPYLALLAVLPGHQGLGLGTAMLDWLEAEGKAGEATNLWVCASSFNVRAIAFYQTHGFATVGTLGDLVKPGFDEIFLRKRL